MFTHELGPPAFKIPFPSFLSLVSFHFLLPVFVLSVRLLFTVGSVNPWRIFFISFFMFPVFFSGFVAGGVFGAVTATDTSVCDG